MDKNAIKKYAVWARREFISRVTQKAGQYGISEKEIIPADAENIFGKVLTATEKKQRQELIAKINREGFTQVMEEAAYTWFNRFCALRFMEVNGYLPTHIRVFTNDAGEFKPQIITEAINLELDGLDMEKVYALKDANDDAALFKYLVIVQCNALSAILPGIFQKINDYTELLFPDNLLRDGSAIEQMVTLIPEADWQDQVQIIGWLYQYYNTEQNELVYDGSMSKSRIPKELLSAATTIYTPDWPVRYMVENSLGRIWVEGHPNDELKANWKYYLEEAEQEPQVQSQLAEIRKGYAALSPESLRCIDPCCGSGHILVYMFDVLMQIYESCGYSQRDAATLIVQNNLYGLDIDERAAQLAYFSVMMKARQYDRRFFTRGVQPHVYAIAESNDISNGAVQYFINARNDLKSALQPILTAMHDAKEYGSILTVPQVDFELLYQRFDEVIDDINFHKDEVLSNLLPVVQCAELLAQKYHVVCTNPPYMGGSGMSGKLSDYVKKYYPDSKSDLFAVCIEKGNNMVEPNGINCMVTMQSWMFLSSFEKMRTNILQNKTITNLMHMENMVLGIAFGTAVTCFQNATIHNYKGTYNQIKLCDIEDDKPKSFPVQGNRFAQVSTDNFAKIPGCPVAYWISKPYIGIFLNGEKCVGSEYVSGGRNKTHNDEKYLRMLWEVPLSDKWRTYAKGGAYRKWYGDIEYLVDWSASARAEYAKHGGLISKDFWNRKGVTWTIVTSYKPSFRIKDAITIYSSVSPTIFGVSGKENDRYFLALLNSNVGESLLDIVNPTLATNVSNVLGVPLRVDAQDAVNKIVSNNIMVSKIDWDSYETSWDFKRNPLV